MAPTLAAAVLVVKALAATKPRGWALGAATQASLPPLLLELVAK